MKDQDLSAVPAHIGKTKEQLINELVGMYQRIAELERLETQRKQAEQEKAAILNSMIELLIFQDLEHRVIWANKAAGESVGLTPEQLVGRHCYKIWHKRSKPCKDCPVAKANKTAKPQVGEIITPDGRTWFLRSYPMKDTGGNIVGMVELVLDITDRKQKEEELRKHREHLEELVKERTAELTAANEQLQQEITQRKQANEALGKTEQEKRAILDSMSEFVVYQDKETRILWANKAAGESVGLTPEQLVGRHCYEIWHKRSKPCKDCPVIKAWKTGQTHQAERITPDGSVRFVRAYPLQDGNGKVLGIVEVVLDITDRKRAEGALKKSESKLRKQKMALEQKNIALREIIAQIEIEKNRIKEDMATNVNELLLPILVKLKIKEVSSKYVDLLKHHLQELASPFGRKITKKSVRLTLREIEMCALIKGGLTSKETAKLLSLSYKTVEKHRKNIRRKLRIANKNVNLASFLKTL